MFCLCDIIFYAIICLLLYQYQSAFSSVSVPFSTSWVKNNVLYRLADKGVNIKKKCIEPLWWWEHCTTFICMLFESICISFGSSNISTNERTCTHIKLYWKIILSSLSLSNANVSLAFHPDESWGFQMVIKTWLGLGSQFGWNHSVRYNHGIDRGCLVFLRILLFVSACRPDFVTASQEWQHFDVGVWFALSQSTEKQNQLDCIIWWNCSYHSSQCICFLYGNDLFCISLS